LFPDFFSSLLKALEGLDFHNRRSLTCGYESYVLSGRSAFSKADGFSDARRASLQEVRRIVFHSASIKELPQIVNNRRFCNF
jgi:hypothetical protein